MSSMTIGKLAREAGVGVETVRFYERRGLVEQPPKPENSGFRHYPREAVERIRFIRRAQEIGFTLREIDDLLSLRADPATDSADVRERALAKLAEVDRRIAHLADMRGALEDLIAACPGGGALGTCSIMESLVGASPNKWREGNDED